MDKRPIVVFGAKKMAALVAYCLQHDSEHQVVAFTVDRQFMGSDSMEGLPIVAFEDLLTQYPPSGFRMIHAIGYWRINGVRKEKYLKTKQMGYEHINYVSSAAKVWPNVSLGDNVIVFEHSVVQPFCRVGSNTIIRSSAHISHHSTVGDHVFIGAGVVGGGSCRVGDQVFVGVGSVMRDGIRMHERSFLGAGAVLVSDTEADAVYVGNPARKTGKSSLEVT